MCRHLYNWALTERKEAFEKDKTKIKYQDQQNRLLKKVKEERPWYKSVHSLALQDVLHRLDNAYMGFYRRFSSKKKGVAFGYPKYKRQGDWNSLTYSQYATKKTITDTFFAPKVGDIKIKKHRELPEGTKIKTLQIRKEGEKWFACFSCEIENKEHEPKRDFLKPVGLDCGVHDLVYPSIGEPIKAPRVLRSRLKSLQKLQRRWNKAKEAKDTVAMDKLKRRLSKAWYRVKCARNDFLHKTSNQIVSEFDLIVMEKLNIAGLVKKPEPKPELDDKGEPTGHYLPNMAKAKAGLSKSILDASWGKLIKMIQYKAEACGKLLLLVDPKYTSQECSSCHEIVKKALSTRTHKCAHCGFVAHRDHNAALNILALGLESLGIQSLEAHTIAFA